MAIVGARTKSVIGLIKRSGAELGCSDDELARVVSLVSSDSFRVADGELQAYDDGDWARVGRFKQRELYLDPDPSIMRWQDANRPRWKYVSGTEREHKDSGVRESWDGTKWAENLTSLGKTAEEQSRMSEMSPLGTDRKPLSIFEDEGATLYVVEDGELGLGLVEVIQTPAGRDVWLDDQTLARIEGNSKLDEQFTEDARRWDPGMKYLMEDVRYSPFFKDAVTRKQIEERNSKAKIIETDPVDRITSDARALLIQAAEYNAAPAPLVLESFGVRLGELRSELAELERRLEEAKETLGLASVAVMEIAS